MALSPLEPLFGAIRVNNCGTMLVMQETSASIQKRMGNAILDKAMQFYEALTPEVLSKMSGQQLSWSFGVFFDKWRLITNQSTQNVSHNHTIRKAISCLED